MTEKTPPEEGQAKAVSDDRPEDREVVVRFRMPRMPRFLPEETRTHLRAAQREMLLALRSVIDDSIKNLERGPEAQSRRATRIEIR